MVELIVSKYTPCAICSIVATKMWLLAEFKALGRTKNEEDFFNVSYFNETIIRSRSSFRSPNKKMES